LTLFGADDFFVLSFSRAEERRLVLLKMKSELPMEPRDVVWDCFEGYLGLELRFGCIVDF